MREDIGFLMELTRSANGVDNFIGWTLVGVIVLMVLVGLISIAAK